MPKYTVFLFRSGRVYVREGVHAAPNAIQPPILTTTVEATNEYGAMGKLLLELYDAANQPFQHICPPCDKPHVDDPFDIEGRLTEHTDTSCTADKPCLACTQRMYGL